MIYVIAFFLPPLALLFNGQPFAAIFTAVIWPICFFFGFFSPVVWLIPSAIAIVAIAVRNDSRRHQEMVDAVKRHGPPPGWQP